MGAVARLGVFLLVVVAAFSLAYGVGGFVGPLGEAPPAVDQPVDDPSGATHGH